LDDPKTILAKYAHLLPHSAAEAAAVVTGIVAKAAGSKPEKSRRVPRAARGTGRKIP
jgi:hypothetical protein